jgi:hypothetical protein
MQPLGIAADATTAKAAPRAVPLVLDADADEDILK